MKIFYSHHMKADIVRKPNSGIALDVKKYIHKGFSEGLMDDGVTIKVCHVKSLSGITFLLHQQLFHVLHRSQL